MCLTSDNGIVISLGDLSQIAMYIIMAVFIAFILIISSKITHDSTFVK